ncbi:ATP-binding cassette domain-containing protein [Glaciibacter superstes]|uniref:ATP-binding cassette domain-containing protein n=1 Tax=Glaciibacter superstes TaxID=501023 RepID=UPI00316AE022
MLDPAGVAAVRDALNEATADYGPAVVLVEHRIDDFAGAAGIAGLPPRALVLGESGRVLADGPTAQVLEAHASTLNENGCWLPLESELLAVTGVAGGLRSAAARHAVIALGVESGGVESGGVGREQERSTARDNADTLLMADELVISRSAQPVRRRHRTASVVDVEGAILHDVNLRLRRGEIVALLGANGSGKTSLLLTLAGLLPAARGTVTGARPGLVFQNPEHQFVANTVRDEIAHGLPGLDAEHVDDILARHRLGHLAARNPFRLSGGEKRRLSLAAMLAHDRPVLLADEPTFGLDRRDTISAIAALRAAAADGRGVLFASHDLRTVSALADRVIVLAGGTVIADGPTVETLRRRNVLERAGLSLPPLLDFLLTECGSDERVQRVLARLDRAVSAAGVYA